MIDEQIDAVNEDARLRALAARRGVVINAGTERRTDPQIAAGTRPGDVVALYDTYVFPSGLILDQCDLLWVWTNGGGDYLLGTARQAEEYRRRTKVPLTAVGADQLLTGSAVFVTGVTWIDYGPGDLSQVEEDYWLMWATDTPNPFAAFDEEAAHDWAFVQPRSFPEYTKPEGPRHIDWPGPKDPTVHPMPLSGFTTDFDFNWRPDRGVHDQTA